MDSKLRRGLYHVERYRVHPEARIAEAGRYRVQVFRYLSHPGTKPTSRAERITEGNKDHIRNIFVTFVSFCREHPSEHPETPQKETKQTKKITSERSSLPSFAFVKNP